MNQFLTALLCSQSPNNPQSSLLYDNSIAIYEDREPQESDAISDLVSQSIIVRYIQSVIAVLFVLYSYNINNIAERVIRNTRKPNQIWNNLVYNKK